MSYNDDSTYEDEELKQIDAFEAQIKEQEKKHGLEQSVHRDGDTVEETGDYVCSPCGYRTELKAGDTFPSCVECLKSQETNEGPIDDGESGENTEHKDKEEDGEEETTVIEKGIWEKAVDVSDLE